MRAFAFKPPGWARAALLATAAVLACGQPARAEKRLEVGDPLPPVELDSLLNSKPLALKVEDGKLTFHDDDGTVSDPKAAIVFFSRY